MKKHESQPPVAVYGAKGPWIQCEDGHKVLDGVSSWWVNLFGHSHPYIKQALTDQLERLDHIMLAGFTHEPVVELSERLSKLSRLGHAFYASDGASATEIALKMSAHYWRNVGRLCKYRFVGLAGGYHGETVGALAVTDIALFRQAYAPLVQLGAVVPSPDARQAGPGESAEGVARRAAASLESFLSKHHADTAALILEPLVQCASGMAMYHPLYLQLARELCDRYEVHLVMDEIAVGFGRTGTFFAHEQAGIRPDFLCLSKGITGGVLPLSVVLTTDAVYDAFYDDATARGFLHSHSYTGNPLACRAALATLDLFERLNVLETNKTLAQSIGGALEPLAQHPRVRNHRQLGMIWACDVDSEMKGFSDRYHREAMKRGLLLRPIGNTIYVMPPYLLEEAEVEHIGQAAYGALLATLKGEKE